MIVLFHVVPDGLPGRRNLSEEDLIILQILTGADKPEAENLHVLPHHTANGGTGNGKMAVRRTEEMQLLLFAIRGLFTIGNKNRCFCGHCDLDFPTEKPGRTSVMTGQL